MDSGLHKSPRPRNALLRLVLRMMSWLQEGFGEAGEKSEIS